MKLQEMIKSLDELSMEERISLFDILQQRLQKEITNEHQHTEDSNGDVFWQGLLNFRERIEKEGIIFRDDNFADLRDKSPGREIVLTFLSSHHLRSLLTFLFSRHLRSHLQMVKHENKQLEGN